jgi:hypothetical protein
MRSPVTLVVLVGAFVAAFAPGRAFAACGATPAGPPDCSVPAGPPPPISTPSPSPDVPPGFSLAIYGRLRTGGILSVRENAGADENYTPQAATLCYKHGSSRQRCAYAPVYTGWTVVVLPGQRQYLTLRIGGKVVARRMFRNVRVGLPATLIPAPDPSSPVFASMQQEPQALYGPAFLKIGELDYFASTTIDHSTLCYKHGSSRVNCTWSRLGGFFIRVQPGGDQYFTLRTDGKVIGRLIYRSVR